MMGRFSGLYRGAVIHTRLRPRRHRLRYRMFMMAFDLDELDDLQNNCRLFSHDRFNLFSFFDRDHGEGSAEPLRVQIEHRLGQAGLSIAGGAVRLVCMPRLLGFVFNPISVYYCHGANGALVAMLYEVNNTFGERHTYLIPADPTAETIRQSCAKRLHVSPFMDMDMSYDFRLTIPSESVSLNITGRDAEGPLIATCFAGRRREVTDGALISAFFSYPLLTLAVVAGIHWEALKLFLKGIKVRRLPQAPKQSVSIVVPHASSREGQGV